jgi:hypothetical protein
MASLRTIIGIIVLANLPGLMGCAVVDQYSGRAVSYNVEAEQAQEQALLLNVVRAYLRRPMQFTSVSTITGSASASGGLGYTAPVNVPFRPITNGSSIAAFPPLNTWSMSAGMSGGPTFTVPVLDTQEFYDGIMKPISGQMYDLYNQSDYPRDLLFNLFVSRVVMTLADNPKCSNCQKCQDPNSSTHSTKPQSMGDCEFVFHNYVGDEIELELFQALGDYLMYLGLSTEAQAPAEDYFKNAQTNPNIHGLEIRLSGSPLSGGSATAAGDSGSASDNQTKSYGVCFSPQTPDAADNVPEARYWCKTVKLESAKTMPKHQTGSTAPSTADIEQAKDANAKAEETITPTGSAVGKVVASRDFVTKLIGIAGNPSINKLEPGLDADLKKFYGKPVYLSFYLRSVQSMIYYLGEVARRCLNPEYGQSSRVVFIKVGPRYAKYPIDMVCTVTTPNCQPLFVLKEDAIPNPRDFLATIYEGNRYSIPSTTTGGGYSSPVLEVIKQQLALNSSAKSLPQSNVISVVGQ